MSGYPCLVALRKCSVNRKSPLIWGASVRGFGEPETREWGAEGARPGVRDLPSHSAGMKNTLMRGWGVGGRLREPRKRESGCGNLSHQSRPSLESEGPQS